MNVKELVDRFVLCASQLGDSFEPINDAPWIAQLEQKLPARLPVSFSSLVTRYSFPPFEAGPLSLYANMGTDDVDEMCVAIFSDPSIADATLKAGYVQFARPITGSYDPICFDTRQSAGNREFPIVRIDHESILCQQRIHAVERVADSFYKFVVDFLSQA